MGRGDRAYARPRRNDETAMMRLCKWCWWCWWRSSTPLLGYGRGGGGAQQAGRGRHGAAGRLHQPHQHHLPGRRVGDHRFGGSARLAASPPASAWPRSPFAQSRCSRCSRLRFHPSPAWVLKYPRPRRLAASPFNNRPRLRVWLQFGPSWRLSSTIRDLLCRSPRRDFLAAFFLKCEYGHE